MNSVNARNFTRSANAPVMSAGVMTANMHWNATNASSGIVPPSSTLRPTFASPNFSRLPMKPPTSVPNVIV